MARYNVGDWVENLSEGYKFQGVIIAVSVEKGTGEACYTVELRRGCSDDGMRINFSETRLRPWTPPERTIEHLVAKKLLQRREFGLQKYGKGLEQRDDIDFAGWLVHLQEECLDAANYIQVLLTRLESLKSISDVEAVHGLQILLTHLNRGSYAADTNTKGNESR